MMTSDEFGSAMIRAGLRTILYLSSLYVVRSPYAVGKRASTTMRDDLVAISLPSPRMTAYGVDHGIGDSADLQLCQPYLPISAPPLLPSCLAPVTSACPVLV